MRIFILCSLLFLISCNNNSDSSEDTLTNNQLSYDSTPVEIVTPVWDTAVPVLNPRSNQIFKDVVVERISEDSFKISGKASIHEANINWELEDGNNILGNGFATASAAAPNWGNFNFIVAAPKENENTSIHLILFEESMKDGKHKNNLPIYLY